MESLPLIAASDQLMALLDVLRSQITCILEVLVLSPEQRARIAKSSGDIEATVTSIEDLLAFERSAER